MILPLQEGHLGRPRARDLGLESAHREAEKINLKEVKMGANFGVFRDSAKEFRFNLHAPNGEKILHSEGYSSKIGCLSGIVSVKANSPSLENYDTYKDSAGKHRFRLRARNREIIGHSEAYESLQGCNFGISSVMRNAPVAEIIDQTNE
jgi:uncharacterized protein YegP (UPF0339 family)